MPRRPLRAEDLAPARLGQLDEERLRDVARVVGDVGDDDLLEAVASAEERRADVVIYRRTNVPFVEALRIIEPESERAAVHEAPAERVVAARERDGGGDGGGVDGGLVRRERAAVARRGGGRGRPGRERGREARGRRRPLEHQGVDGQRYDDALGEDERAPAVRDALARRGRGDERGDGREPRGRRAARRGQERGRPAGDGERAERRGPAGRGLHAREEREVRQKLQD